MELETEELPAMSTKPDKRPDPFGPAWALLPKGQEVLVLEDKTTAGEAVERMVDSGYSETVLHKTTEVPILSRPRGAVTKMSFECDFFLSLLVQV